MTLNPTPIPFALSPIPAHSAAKELFSSHGRRFTDVDPRTSTSFILSDTVMTEVDAALTLFRGILRTRQDFISVATLWALDSIKENPKLALRKLAATGAVTEIARMDDKHGRADGENTVA